MRQLRQDHPRSRGVYSVTRPVMNAVGRIIPARAGFTRCCRWLSASWPDHPRSRGVYRTTRVSRPHPTGLSPLARGLQAHNPPVYHTNRIIPARAGFTSTENLAQKIAADHPRSRGVYAATCGVGHPVHGSSPLARGLLIAELQEMFMGRIIPARAGFTAVDWDGECASDGSSPLARGLHFILLCLAADAGIIPARAGFTAVDWDGECASDGSSPLARGLRYPGDADSGEDRIIPARAGFTSQRSSASRWTQDHPRSRGVYASQ